MDTNIQIIESVNERDIDLLILEELNVNTDFLNYFIEKNDLPKFLKENIALRSITESGLGETDILLSYIDIKNKKNFILIENKVDADFQKRQYERYVERAEKYKKEKKCDLVSVILVAPNDYLKSQNDFEKTFSYEEIIDFFDKNKNKRFLFKKEILEIAIKKLRRGYQVVNSEIVQNFWLEYFNLKEKVLPELEMKKPVQVPHESDWIRMKNKKFNFVHKLRNGYFDIEFKTSDEQFREKILNLIEDDSELVIYKSGNFAIRYQLDPLDRTKKFYEQIEKVERDFEKIKLINSFCEKILNDMLS